MVGCTSVFRRKSIAMLYCSCSLASTLPYPLHSAETVFKEMSAPKGAKWLFALKVMMSLEVAMQTVMDMKTCSSVNRAGTWGPGIRVKAFL